MAAERKIRLAVLISGPGSNLDAIIRATRGYNYPAEIGVVISDRIAPGLKRADDVGIPIFSIAENGSIWISREERRRDFAVQVDELICAFRCDLIVLAGFMLVLDPNFVRSWATRIINIHPSLLPAFRGLNPYRQALDAGVTMSGCTVHYVVPEIDAGRIISQVAVPVAKGDTEDTLAARILEREHWLYPATIRVIADQILDAR